MQIIIDTLLHTGRLVPLLAFIYFLVGFLEYRYGSGMGRFILRFGAFGPVIGAIFGCVPQCGFSVVASALYVRRFISLGTLLAVFLSTSDEAVPVLLAIPEKANMVGSLIITKIIIAVVAGMVVDLFSRFIIKSSRILLANTAESSLESSGCCDHELDGKHSKIKSLVIHPLKHTIKIFLFLLFLSLILNFLIVMLGTQKIATLLLQGTIFQPVLTALVGLVPNCFASVLLADLFARGAISFGAMTSGLCAASGFGLLVLFKENKSLRDTLKVVSLLLIISILSGVILQSLIGC